MKHAREIKIALLGLVCLCILYFGFNFLKGVNIFSPIHTYVSTFENLKGLTVQAPVYVRGYKVGQVDEIIYDFTKTNAFTIKLSIDKNIVLPEGTQLALAPDGLLGGMALEVKIPAEDATPYYNDGDTLPSIVIPGLFDVLQSDLIANLSQTILNIDSLVVSMQNELSGGNIQSTLQHINKVTADLEVSSAELKQLMGSKVPTIVGDVEAAMGDIKNFSGNLQEVDIAATIHQVDSAVLHIKDFMNKLNSTDGTLGLLMNDKQLYLDVTAAVNSADSLLIDLKANPKRYVHFSVFGNKDK